ncbi:Cnl2/NKP2 family protein [Colletotrichum musicola]|uniref:Cnl2/NKP2 family protein n=1 Tax=Colletotrichum musicola TaxID=2175873 RepID=A0A8H6U809_9PEZI|nr:Cnl2/NKP2 family protein [Colletotrichum musicola]
MAPTESDILHNYLTVPAQLPSIVSLEEFTELFPKSHRSNPQIRLLYRDLQHQRRALVDTVADNIAREEQEQSKFIKREIASTRRRAARQEADQELEIERALFGASEASNPKHTLISIIPEMDAAIADLEAEIQKLEAQESELRESVEQTVGTMSDLRYGRLSNPKLREDVIQGLKSVQEVCEDKS